MIDVGQGYDFHGFTIKDFAMNPSATTPAVPVDAMPWWKSDSQYLRIYDGTNTAWRPIILNKNTINSGRIPVWDGPNGYLGDGTDYTVATTVGDPGVDTALVTEQGIREAIDAAIASEVTWKGGYNANTNTPDLDVSPSGVKKGDMYYVTVAGDFFTEAVEAGDVLIANIDDADALAEWTVVQKNLPSTIPVSGGGTGQTGITQYAMWYASATDTLSELALTTAGGIIIGGSTGPAVAVITEGEGINITNADQSITIDLAFNEITNAGTPTGSDLFAFYDATTDTRMEYITYSNLVTALEASMGFVTATPTPVDNQIAIWTSGTNLEGSANLTYNPSTGAMTMEGTSVSIALDWMTLKGTYADSGISCSTTTSAGVDLTIQAGESTGTTAEQAGSLTLMGGEQNGASGNGNGGDVHIGGGASVSGGSRGNIYFGDGSTTAYLPAKGSETQVIYYNTTTGQISYGTPSSGTTEFTGLNDTPTDYTGAADKLLAVNGTPNAVVFRDIIDFTAITTIAASDELLVGLAAGGTRAITWTNMLSEIAADLNLSDLTDTSLGGIADFTYDGSSAVSIALDFTNLTNETALADADEFAYYDSGVGMRALTYSALKTALNTDLSFGSSDVASLNDLTDVTITSAAQGQALIRTGSGWVNKKIRHAQLLTTSASSYDIQHSLGTTRIFVICQDTDGKDIKVEWTVRATDPANYCTVTFGAAPTANTRIITVYGFDFDESIDALYPTV